MRKVFIFTDTEGSPVIFDNFEGKFYICSELSETMARAQSKELSTVLDDLDLFNEIEVDKIYKVTT